MYAGLATAIGVWKSSGYLHDGRWNEAEKFYSNLWQNLLNLVKAHGSTWWNQGELDAIGGLT